MKKRIIIIGAGIAGLNSGIELLQKGYDVEIYEKNDEVGGLCSGYFVDGYNIDACLHWLMGTKKGTILNTLWKNNGALTDDIEISNLPFFCSFLYKGTKVTFSRNLEEEEARWIDLAPSDAKVIHNFFKSVKNLATLWDLTQDENRTILSKDAIKVVPNAASIIKSMRMSRKDYAKQFTHPALRFAIENAMTGYNNAYFFMQVYALFSTGDGNVPMGGAYKMIQRIKERYLSLGGKLYLNNPIDEFIVEENHINGAKSNNQIIIGDYYISALDNNYTLKKLLKNQYHTRTYDYLNNNIKNNPISSSFCVYVRTTKDVSHIDVPTCIKIQKIKVGAKKVDSLLVRPYGFDKEYQYQDGSTVISLFVDQNQDDYAYFKHLENYEKEEKRIIKDMISSLEEIYPELKGNLVYLTHFGPLEIKRQTNTSFGALQAYSFAKTGVLYQFSGKLRKIDNLYMCGQWNRSIGGTPTALLSSHEIVKKIVKQDNKKPIYKTLIDKMPFKKKK